MSYEKYLNEGEIDEESIRQDLKTPELDIESEIAERLELALECERELIDDQGKIVIVPDDELEAMRDVLEEEIRREVEEEEELALDERVENMIRQIERDLD